MMFRATTKNLHGDYATSTVVTKALLSSLAGQTLATLRGKGLAHWPTVLCAYVPKSAWPIIFTNVNLRRKCGGVRNKKMASFWKEICPACCRPGKVGVKKLLSHSERSTFMPILRSFYVQKMKSDASFSPEKLDCLLTQIEFFSRNCFKLYKTQVSKCALII